MKIAVSGISSLIDSNIFLRAFWSELRNRFGKCAWHYQPFKDGSSRTIFLGWADINKERTVSISLSYSQKSIVNGIHFGEQFDETIDESSELGRQLKDAVKTAFDRRHKPSIETFQVPISSLYSSTIDSNPPEKCSNCGQKQYKISARVVDYVTKYLGLKEGHHLSKVFKSHYEKRSKYLHAGVMLTDNSYTGTTIPRLDPSSDSGVSQRTSVLLTNLREWIGYMLRQQLKTM